MINQGEPIHFSGILEIAENSQWNTVSNLTPYVVNVLVINANTNTKLLFSSASQDVNKKITLSGQNYTFTIPGSLSKNLLGECLIEVSISSDGSPIIADNKGKFFVQESTIGKLL